MNDHRLEPAHLSRYRDPFDKCAGLPFHYCEDLKVGGRIWVFGFLALRNEPFEARIEALTPCGIAETDRSSVAVFFRTVDTGAGGNVIIRPGVCTEMQGVQLLEEIDDGEPLYP